MIREDYNRLVEIMDLFKRLKIYDRIFFDNIVFESKIINVKDINEMNELCGFFVDTNLRKMKIVLPSGGGAYRNIERLRICVKAYIKYLKLKRRKKIIKYPFMFEYSILRIYALENFNSNEIKMYNKSQLELLDKLKEEELIGFLMQYKIAEEFLELGIFMIPDEFYTDDEHIKYAKENISFVLKRGHLNY